MREPADDGEVEDTLITDRPLVTVDDEARYTPLAPDRRRFIRPLVILLVVVLIAAAGLGSAYAWTRTQYFVGVSGDQVAIYQGLSDGVPGSGCPGCSRCNRSRSRICRRTTRSRFAATSTCPAWRPPARRSWS